jgi:hypothetical protein
MSAWTLQRLCLADWASIVCSVNVQSFGYAIQPRTTSAGFNCEITPLSAKLKSSPTPLSPHLCMEQSRISRPNALCACIR